MNKTNRSIVLLKSKLSHIKTIMTIVLTIFLIIYLVNNRSLLESTTRFIFSEYLLIYLLLYLCRELLRSLRYLVLINHDFNWGRLVKIYYSISFSNMINSILPFSIGELSYIYLLNRIIKLRFLDSIFIHLSSKIIDLGVMLITFMVVTFYGIHISRAISSDNFVVSYFNNTNLYLIILFLIILCLIFRKHFINFLSKFKIIQNAVQRISNFSEISKSISVKRYLLFIIISILMLCIGLIAGFLSIKIVGINISLEEMIWIQLIAALTLFIPVGGVGGYGTYEGLWIVAFGLLNLGFDNQQILLSGLINHTFQVLSVILIGLSSSLIYRIYKFKTKNES